MGDGARLNGLVVRHHRLRAGHRIGETIWYFRHFGNGDRAALAALSAASLKCAAGDEWIGRGMRHQYGHLHLIANNVRMPLPVRLTSLGPRSRPPCKRRDRCRHHQPISHDRQCRNSAGAESRTPVHRGHAQGLDEPTGWNEDHSRIRSGYGPENMT